MAKGCLIPERKQKDASWQSLRILFGKVSYEYNTQ